MRPSLRPSPRALDRYAKLEAKELAHTLSIRSKPGELKQSANSKARLALVLSCLNIGLLGRQFNLVVESLAYIAAASRLRSRYGEELLLDKDNEIGEEALRLLRVHSRK